MGRNKSYDGDVVERNFGPLEAPGAGIKEVRALLEFFKMGGCWSYLGSRVPALQHGGRARSR